MLTNKFKSIYTIKNEKLFEEKIVDVKTFNRR